MTAVMRSVATTGPRVLRVGVVQSGRVVEERIIKQRGHVTVGPHEKNLFVIPSQSTPPSLRLFELIGGDYYLNFVDGMHGRIAMQTGVSDIDTLRAQARRTKEGYYQVKLNDDSRGKIVIGETTFLFQFVAPPPVQPKPQLPVAVIRGTSAIDWPTTIIAAFSFLLHFLAIGALYSDWLDPVVDDELSVAGLIDSVKNLPPPPPVEEKPIEDTLEAVEKGEEKKEQKAAPKGAGKVEPGKMSARQVAALTNELDQLEMATLGALSSAGPATAGVLRSGEVPTSALDQAAASGAGVGAGEGGLKIGGGGGTIRPGEMGSGLAGLGKTGRTEGTQGAGQAKAVKGPKGSARASANVTAGSVSNAASVVARMRAAFRACYQRGLDNNPDIEGKITLTLKVGPNGEVQSVTPSTTGNLPSDVVGCVQSRARAAQFDPPQGGTAVVQVPVTFVKQ
jgi:hypothetical protein